MRQHERNHGGGDGGLSTTERQRLKELEREVRELRRSNDILRQASAYFAKAEFVYGRFPFPVQRGLSGRSNKQKPTCIVGFQLSALT